MVWTGCTCGVIGIGAQHASTCPLFHRPLSAGCSDATPCMAPVLRWVHSPKCREATALLDARQLRGKVATVSRERDEAVIALSKLLAAWDAPADAGTWDRGWASAEAEARRVVAKYPTLGARPVPSGDHPNSSEGE